MMRNKKDSDIAWILITDKLKKEWNKQMPTKKKKKKIKKSSTSKKQRRGLKILILDL